MKVLIVDDEPLSRQTLSDLLERSGYEVFAKENGTEALKFLDEAAIPPQIILADWIMPEMDGIELCKRIRSDLTLPYCFIIMMSSKGESEDVVHALDAGADDYIIKPYNPAELQSRIRAGVRIIKLNTQLEQANQSLQVMASTDVLTSLLNRGAIMDVLEEEISRARRENNSLAVVMGDIDHFKAVNDTHGHIAGDHALREFSVLMKSGVRTYDSVGRYGGEEFLIIMPNIGEDSSKEVVERLRTKVEEYIFRADGQELRLTSSFGIAWGAPGDSLHADDFIRVSDNMLYSAKDAGRNCVKFGMVEKDSPASE